MHILILPSWYPAHPEDINGVFFREQALAVAKYGHQVGVIYPQLRSLTNWKTILTGRKGIEQELDLGMPTLRAHGINWFPRKWFPRANMWLWLRYGLRLYDDYIKQYGQPDLIHVHAMLNAGVLAQEIQRRYGVPFIVTEHFSGYARRTLRPEQLRMAASVAHDATRRFAVSQPLCHLLRDVLGSETGSWEEMPNIVGQSFLDYPLPSLNRSDGKFRFVNIALLTENKGVHHLISAFASVFADQHQIILDIGGDGEQRPRLETLATELGVAERVRFLGALHRDQVIKAIASADAFVLASRYETFGVVVIEALALGKPVIATRCGGPESIIREQDGVLVPADDVEGLANAMQRLQAEHNQYDAKTIRAGCIARYSERTVVERLTQVYSEVMQTSTGA